MKSGNNVKIIPCQKNSNDKNIKYNADYIGKVSLSNKEEYTWEYNNYFEKNKFTKPYENLDWIVIGSTKFFSSNLPIGKLYLIEILFILIRSSSVEFPSFTKVFNGP